MATQQAPNEIAPVTPPAQSDRPIGARLVEVDNFLWVTRARQSFFVNGEDLTVAVLDTGLNTQHVDFAGRIPAQRNFTNDNNGDPNDATDGNGHGTNCAGIIVANADHKGIAPGANVIPLKVLPDRGGGSFAAIDHALQWVLDNRETHNITVVSMSLGDTGNYIDDNFGHNNIHEKIKSLTNKDIAVVIAAGNDYFRHESRQGMGFPAIFRECVSVGAVYDAPGRGFIYGDGSRAFSMKEGQLTPFTQRLHRSVNRSTRTDIFAPGAPVTSSGINGEHGESIQHGTSQATPVISGLMLLMQEFYKRESPKREMPSVRKLTTWLRRGGVKIFDGDDEDDNVEHTNQFFIRADALSALDAVRRDIQREWLEQSLSNR